MLVTWPSDATTARCLRRCRQGEAADPGPPAWSSLPSAGFNRSCRERRNRSPDGIVVIQMSWWEIILFIAVVIFAIYAFASIVGFRTRTLTRPTDRTAQDMYDNYADSPRKQRRYARHHGGEGHDVE
jgi:hypothetical protein